MSDVPLRTEPVAATSCAWNADEDDNWETSCGRLFIFTDGTPIENEFKFCCFCGLSLNEMPYQNDDEQPDDEEALRRG